jgi:hypothetical protein
VVGRQLYSVRRALEAESGIRQKGEADSFLDRSAPQHCGPNHGQAGSNPKVRVADNALREAHALEVVTEMPRVGHLN